MKIVSIYPNFDARGGAQDVLVQLAMQLNRESKSIILTNTPTNQIAKDYCREQLVFQKFSFANVRRLSRDKDVVFISHHRKLTSLIYIYLVLMGCSDRLVHIAHNTFLNLKWATWFPKRVIAVSDAVKENLINYFGLPEHRIKVIYNGVPDVVEPRPSCVKFMGTIKILLAGRICEVKQQLALVRFIQDQLPESVEIYFAGVGEQLEELRETIALYKGYHTLGFIDISKEIYHYDYMMLFSEKEGLPLSLIEGLRSGTPLITNRVGAVLEVNKAGETGFVYESFESLLEGLKVLPLPSSQSYAELSVNARKRYENLFKEEIMIEQYQNYLSELLR